MKPIIVSTVHREPLTLDFIPLDEGFYSYTSDYPGYGCGQYRCLMGHITALAAYFEEVQEDGCALVFEDDAVVGPYDDWEKAVGIAKSLSIDKGFELVSLHCRGEDMSKLGEAVYQDDEFSFHRPPTGHYVLNGTLAYIINRQAAWKFRQLDPWVTYSPIDLTMWSPQFNFCTIKNSPFIHGCGGPDSILENPRNKQYSFV